MPGYASASANNADQNIFDRHAVKLDGHNRGARAVVPSDENDLELAATSLYVETGGAVRFTGVDGHTLTITVPDFGWILCGVKRVYATGTDAEGIIAYVVGR